MAGMDSLLRNLQRACTVLCGVALSLISAIMFLAVVFRYVFVSPIVWAEEITGFFLVWMVLLGAPVGYRTKEHVAIDFLILRLPPRWKPYLRIVHAGIVFFVAAVIVRYGFPHTLKSMNQIFPTVEWIRYGYMYLALPVGYILVASYCVEELYLSLRSFRGKGE